MNDYDFKFWWSYTYRNRFHLLEYKVKILSTNCFSIVSDHSVGDYIAMTKTYHMSDILKSSEHSWKELFLDSYYSYMSAIDNTLLSND